MSCVNTSALAALGQMGRKTTYIAEDLSNYVVRINMLCGGRGTRLGGCRCLGMGGCEVMSFGSCWEEMSKRVGAGVQRVGGEFCSAHRFFPRSSGGPHTNSHRSSDHERTTSDRRVIVASSQPRAPSPHGVNSPRGVKNLAESGFYKFKALEQGGQRTCQINPQSNGVAAKLKVEKLRPPSTSFESLQISPQRGRGSYRSVDGYRSVDHQSKDGVVEEEPLFPNPKPMSNTLTGMLLKNEDHNNGTPAPARPEAPGAPKTMVPLTPSPISSNGNPVSALQQIIDQVDLSKKTHEKQLGDRLEDMRRKMVLKKEEMQRTLVGSKSPLLRTNPAAEQEEQEEQEEVLLSGDEGSGNAAAALHPPQLSPEADDTTPKIAGQLTGVTPRSGGGLMSILSSNVRLRTPVLRMETRFLGF